MKLDSNFIILPSNLHKNLITLDFNESCNNKCLNCPRNYRLQNSSLLNYWTYDEAVKLIDYLVTHFTPYAIHIGILAEFCIYPYAGKILKYINTNYPNLGLLCTTNLTNLSDDLFNAIVTGNNQLTLNASMWAYDKDSYKYLHGTDLFDRFNNNLIRLVKEIPNIESKIMVSTVNKDQNQYLKCINYLTNICNEYSIKLVNRSDLRESIGSGLLTVYTNVYNDLGLDNNTDYSRKLDTISNEALNFKCDLISNGIYLTYNKLYACPSSSVVCQFDITTLSKLTYKLCELDKKGATLNECKNCIVAYACLNRGN